MYQNDANKVLTGECRLSYVNLITPRPVYNSAAADFKEVADGNKA